MCFAPKWRTLFSTSRVPRVARSPQLFTLLTWKCASRHNGVHFFDISTSKSGLELKSFGFFFFFVHFDLKMYFAPKWRFQKWSEPVVLCTFWLRNVLRATAAYTFSTSQLAKVLRTHQFLTLLTCKCASRHNAVHFFDISSSKSAPNLRCFHFFTSKLCFAPQRRATFHLSFGQLAPHPPL